MIVVPASNFGGRTTEVLLAGKHLVDLQAERYLVLPRSIEAVYLCYLEFDAENETSQSKNTHRCL